MPSVEGLAIRMTAGELQESLVALQEKLEDLKLMLHYAANNKELAEVRTQMKEPSLWDNPARAKLLGKREARLVEIIEVIDKFASRIQDANEIFDLAQESSDEQSKEGSQVDPKGTSSDFSSDSSPAPSPDQNLLHDLSVEVEDLKTEVEKIEDKAMFGGVHDDDNAFMEIQAGQGGTEAQDWAEMLLRMYLKWGDSHKMKSEVLELSPGEVAGIKGASIRFIGLRAYGWLRTETGIHRLVRKSPFNSGNRRHTSFASVFVTPELDANIEVEINAKDLRIDTYRASGAGGQHINKTDSAVRITHLPSGVVVQCQNQRSQHQNKDSAMRQLKSKLYLIEEEKQNAEKRSLEETKDEISWGRQIRSYVLDDSRIKDLRTGIEKSDCPRVLDGDLDDFIFASLQQQARSAISK